MLHPGTLPAYHMPVVHLCQAPMPSYPLLVHSAERRLVGVMQVSLLL